MSGDKRGACQGQGTSRWRLQAAVLMLSLALLLLPIATVEAGELQILAGGAIAGPLRELAAPFERAAGHTLVFRFGTTPELITLATTGGPFDLGIVPVDVMKDVAARARFASGAILILVHGRRVQRSARLPQRTIIAQHGRLRVTEILVQATHTAIFTGARPASIRSGAVGGAGKPNGGRGRRESNRSTGRGSLVLGSSPSAGPADYY